MGKKIPKFVKMIRVLKTNVDIQGLSPKVDHNDSGSGLGLGEGLRYIDLSLDNKDMHFGCIKHTLHQEMNV